jgi:serine/threonine protein kinase, bacterial
MRRVLLILFLLSWCISVGLASGGSNSNSSDKWGALAYSDSTGRYGFAYDYASQAAAINAAVERCKARDCRGVVWFRNSCGAFAKGDGAYGWGIGDSRALAEAKALAECRKRGGDCRIIQWACTSR